MKFARYSFITVTITTADPAVFTSVAHELTEEDTVWLETSSSLPTGLSEDTTYYVIRNGITADTFQVSATRGGDPIETTADGAGTQKFIKTNRAALTPLAEDNR